LPNEHPRGLQLAHPVCTPARPTPANGNAACLPAPQLLPGLSRGADRADRPAEVQGSNVRVSLRTKTDRPWAGAGGKAFPRASSPSARVAQSLSPHRRSTLRRGRCVPPSRSDACASTTCSPRRETVDCRAAHVLPAEAAPLLRPSNPPQLGFSSIQRRY